MKRSNPMVSIVGAGPGEVELLTLKAYDRISSCRAILYDALINEEILNLASMHAELIYVGKRCGRRSIGQNDINLTLYQKAKELGHIVRLKGGDPFIFGRGHEEMRFLKSLHIEVEVIAGISSCTGLPLSNNIPLTCREYSESFWVLTGTTKEHQLSDDLRLAMQSRATIVLLMAIRKIEQIAKSFVANGKGSVPLMVIQNGSLPSEKVIVSTAIEILQRLDEIISGAPGIIVVGEVVSLHPNFVHEKAICTWT